MIYFPDIWTNLSDELSDQWFAEKSDEAFQKIDCLSCANCCKTISPIIEPEEIVRLASAVGVSTEELFDKYIEMDEDGDFVFRVQPCPMLNEGDNSCRIYDMRPRACREYPHVNMKNMRQYRELLEKNHEICPIVQEVVKSIRIELEK